MCRAFRRWRKECWPVCPTWAGNILLLTEWLPANNLIQFTTSLRFAGRAGWGQREGSEGRRDERREGREEGGEGRAGAEEHVQGSLGEVHIGILEIFRYSAPPGNPVAVQV